MHSLRRLYAKGSLVLSYKKVIASFQVEFIFDIFVSFPSFQAEK